MRFMCVLGLKKFKRQSDTLVKKDVKRWPTPKGGFFGQVYGERWAVVNRWGVFGGH